MFNKTVSFVFALISLVVLTRSNSTTQKESIRSRLVNFKIELTTVCSWYNHTDFRELPFAGAIPNTGENETWVTVAECMLPEGNEDAAVITVFMPLKF